MKSYPHPKKGEKPKPPLNAYGDPMVYIDNEDYTMNWTPDFTPDLGGKVWYASFNETTDDIERSNEEKGFDFSGMYVAERV